MLSRLLHRRRPGGGGSGPVDPGLGAPPDHYLWLMDPATDLYAVDEDDLYILVPDPSDPP